MVHLIIHCSHFLSVIASFRLLKRTQVTLNELPFNTQLTLAAVVPCFPAAEDADPAACHQTSAICRSDPPRLCQIEENSSQISSQFKLYYNKVANNATVILTLFLFTVILNICNFEFLTSIVKFLLQPHLCFKSHVNWRLNKKVSIFTLKDQNLRPPT